MAQVWADEVATLGKILAAHVDGYGRHFFFKKCKGVWRVLSRQENGVWRALRPENRKVVTCRLEVAVKALVEEIASLRSLRLCSALLGVLGVLGGILKGGKEEDSRAKPSRTRDEERLPPAKKQKVAAKEAPTPPPPQQPKKGSGKGKKGGGKKGAKSGLKKGLALLGAL